MQIVVNGTARDLSGLAQAPTMADVIMALDLKGDRIAVEQNGSIVPRADWLVTPVVEGDKLEVVHFVGGGSDRYGCWCDDPRPRRRSTLAFRALSRRALSRPRLSAACLLVLCLPVFTTTAAMAGMHDYPSTDLRPSGKPTLVVPEFNANTDLKIVAYGDTRFTDTKNTSDASPRPRRFLVDRIAEEAPDAVFFSGDLPFHGSDLADWEVYRQETAPWSAAHLRVYPTLGNHEFVPDPYYGLKNYFDNFPLLNGNRWYSVQMGSVYLVVIDSMRPPTPGSVQRAWLEDQLEHIPPTVNFVFFLLHMPLVTDIQTQMLVDLPSPEQIELRKYIETVGEKSRAKFVVIGGHIHNYERFERGRVSYVVSGGGGARPYPVLVRGDQDLYRQPGFPNFHYLVIQVHGKQATVTMKRIADPEAASMKLEVRETFTLNAR